MSNTTITPDTATARKAMIDSQLRTSGVNEEYILARMLAVPREEYVSQDMAAVAYIDRAIALEGGAHLASPLFYGKVLLEAAPQPKDRVLVVEGGTGYLTDLVRPLVADLETVSASDAAQGNVPDGNFTLILVDGAIEALPDALVDSLDDDGLIVSGLVLRQVTRLASGRKIAGQVTLSVVEDLGIPVLTAFNRPKTWTFS